MFYVLALQSYQIMKLVNLLFHKITLSRNLKIMHTRFYLKQVNNLDLESFINLLIIVLMDLCLSFLIRTGLPVLIHFLYQHVGTVYINALVLMLPIL